MLLTALKRSFSSLSLSPFLVPFLTSFPRAFYLAFFFLRPFTFFSRVATATPNLCSHLPFHLPRVSLFCSEDNAVAGGVHLGACLLPRIHPFRLVLLFFGLFSLFFRHSSTYLALFVPITVGLHEEPHRGEGQRKEGKPRDGEGEERAGPEA